jgi:hypothetical protein
MICLNINTTSKYVQFWVQNKRDNMIIIDTNNISFQSSSFRSKTPSVYIEISVNNCTTGYVLSPYPMVNDCDDDDGLNLNDIVCITRC